MDPPDDGDDCRTSATDRYSGVGEYRLAPSIPNGFLLTRQRKQIATNSSPFRDQQFQHISALRERFRRQGLPIVSVDSKKREMIGNFKNSGLTVCVGISHDTPDFAAHSIATWWKREGSRRHCRAPKLLVLADSGGSNGCTSWAWKTEIQAQLCNPFGIIATIAHYPTGASKWNPIEHRLFSEISKHWAAEPLVSYEKMLSFIRNTGTKTGLVVTACLDRTNYPIGLKPDRRLISSLALKPAKTLPRWNCTIEPNL